MRPRTMRRATTTALVVPAMMATRLDWRGCVLAGERDVGREDVVC
jgi:hypothetical protein